MFHDSIASEIKMSEEGMYAGSIVCNESATERIDPRKLEKQRIVTFAKPVRLH